MDTSKKPPSSNSALPSHAVTLLLVAAGLAVRLMPLLAAKFGIESDEAIVGLMGKHILDGRPWPVFYYGQPYMGSLEGILAALSFSIFGVTDFALKLVPLTFALVHIGLMYSLGKRYGGKFVALVAALLTAIGPSALIIWSTKARGGYIELVVLGTLALIWTVDALRAGCSRKWHFFRLGLLLGFAWWVNNQVIFYLLAIALVVGPYLLLHTTLRHTFAVLGVSILGFFIGGAPFWWFNFFSEPQFASISFLLGNSGGGDFWDYFLEFLQTSLPIVFGARRFWSRGMESDLFPGASCIAYVAYAVCFAYFLWICFQKRSGSSILQAKTSARYELLLVLAFLVVVPVVFSMTSFGALSEAPRYLLPLYSVLYVMAGIVIRELSLARRQAFRIGGYLMLATMLGLNIASNFWHGIALYDQPFVYKGKRVAKDHSALYRWLNENNYRFIATNYWIGYRVAFETEENVTFRRYGEPRTLRIEEYETPTPEKEEFPVYVLVPGQDIELAHVLSQQGVDFRRTVIGEYVVIDQLMPAHERGPRIELHASQLRATSRPEWLNQLVDENLGTRWGSGSPQQPGMEIAVDFGALETISGIGIDFGLFTHDWPRGLRIEAQLESGEWCVIYNSQDGSAFWEDMRGRFDLYSPPTKVRALRFTQTGVHPVLDWSMAELEIYG